MRYIIGSRSPRRFELLSQIVAAEQIEVLPPLSAEEDHFEGLTTRAEIESRLSSIARRKWNDVCDQWQRRSAALSANRDDKIPPVIIAADTIVLVADQTGRPLVLGKPPAGPAWKETVRDWFRDYYAGKMHSVLTACVIGRPGETVVSRIAVTEIAFRSDVERWLEWYLATGEPLDKAGGYAIQGKGHLFVTRMEGSYSNVVGLPLEEVMLSLQELGAYDV